MKRYEVRGNPNKLCGKDVIESETGDWVSWEEAKWYTKEYQLTDYPQKEVTQEEHESLHQESLSEGN